MKYEIIYRKQYSRRNVITAITDITAVRVVLMKQISQISETTY